MPLQGKESFDWSFSRCILRNVQCQTWTWNTLRALKRSVNKLLSTLIFFYRQIASSVMWKGWTRVLYRPGTIWLNMSILHRSAVDTRSHSGILQFITALDTHQQWASQVFNINIWIAIECTQVAYLTMIINRVNDACSDRARWRIITNYEKD